MHANRSIAVLVLLALPAGTLAQESAGGSANPVRAVDTGVCEPLAAPPMTQIPAPGRSEIFDGRPSGASLILTLKSGERLGGLSSLTGRGRTRAKEAVRPVTGEKKDTAIDGLLLGAAVGAGFGVVLGYGRRTFECRAGCSIAIGTTLLTPVGALVGWLQDRKRNQTEDTHGDASANRR